MSRVFLRKAVTEFLSGMGKYGPADWQRNAQAYHMCESVKYIMKQMCEAVHEPAIGSIHELHANIVGSEMYSGVDVHKFLSGYMNFTRDYLADGVAIISERELRDMESLVGEFLLQLIGETFTEVDEEAGDWTYWISKCLND